MAAPASLHGRRVLLIGGAGFIGSNLALRLVAEGASVTVMDALLEGYGGNPKNLEGGATDIPLLKADARDAASVRQAIRDQEVVVNLFAQVSHIRSLQDPFFDLDVNARANLVVLEEVRKAATDPFLVYAGTRGQTGEPKTLPVTEEHADDPTDMNGINKLSAEKYHRLYHRVHGLRTVSLRLGNTYGPRHQMMHGEYGVLNWFVRRALAGWPIELYGGGAQARDYTFVEDAAEAFRLAMLHLPGDGQHYLVGSDFEASLKHVAEMIVAATGSGSIVEKPYPPGVKAIEVARYKTDFRKIRAACGWHPRIGLDEGIRRTVDFYRARLADYT